MGGIPSAGIAPGIPIIGGMRRPTLVGGATDAPGASAGRGLPHLKHTGVAPCNKNVWTDGNIKRIRPRAKRRKDGQCRDAIHYSCGLRCRHDSVASEGEGEQNELAHAGKPTRLTIRTADSQGLTKMVVPQLHCQSPARVSVVEYMAPV